MRASELKLIHALLPLQLGIAICYQYESAYFPAPYADNQLLCSLCGLKRSHAFNSAGFKHNHSGMLGETKFTWFETVHVILRNIHRGYTEAKMFIIFCKTTEKKKKKRSSVFPGLSPTPTPTPTPTPNHNP